MINIQALSSSLSPKAFINDFISFPKKMYRAEPHWIPWFDLDMKRILTKKHPFFKHSPGEFFLARRNRQTVGRICVVANTRYALQHGRKSGHFFFLDALEESEIFTLLIHTTEIWVKQNGCTLLEGPMLFGGVYGSGLLIEGYDTPAPMTMMPYNFPYYRKFIEDLGYAKFFDVIGADISPRHFVMPEKVSSVAEKVLLRGRFKVLRFKNIKELKARAGDIATMYNSTIGDHLENYPLTDKELEFVKNDLLAVADPSLVKILEYDNIIVGYLFAFRDLNSALKKNNGKVTPLGIMRLLLAMKNNKKVYLNGMGILPEYQRLGGNALLYSELTKTVTSSGFQEAEIVQINEHTDLMLSDIQRLGAIINKRHRIFTKGI